MYRFAQKYLCALLPRKLITSQLVKVQDVGSPLVFERWLVMSLFNSSTNPLLRFPFHACYKNSSVDVLG